MPSTITARASVGDYAEYYHRYISLVPAGDLIAVATEQRKQLRDLLSPLSATQSQFRYAEGKWSIREVVGHLIDTERVFSYRATAFSRRDSSPLPSFDQAAWAPYGEYDSRTLPDLLDEWDTARSATIALMRGMTESALVQSGIASGNPCTVLALLSIMPGHLNYHIDQLHRDYLPRIV